MIGFEGTFPNTTVPQKTLPKKKRAKNCTFLKLGVVYACMHRKIMFKYFIE